MGKSKRVTGFFLLVAAIVSVIFGIVCFNSYPSSYLTSDKHVEYEYYGGDAYTGIQNAAADTANNVQANVETVRSTYYMIAQGFGFALIISGIVLFGCGVGKFFAASACDDAERQAYRRELEQRRREQEQEKRRQEEAQRRAEAADIS